MVFTINAQQMKVELFLGMVLLIAGVWAFQTFKRMVFRGD